MFKAIYVDRVDEAYSSRLVELDEQSLPEGEVKVAVGHSTLNYKDALAITGKGPVMRKFPMVAGIDFAGTVLESQDQRFSLGQPVLATGWGLGEDYWGGLAQRARVPADWLTPIPEPLNSHAAMALGTAGFTAMLCVQALQKQGVTPDKGPVVVTGATGGVGSVAVYLLAKRGYEVVASTGHTDDEGYLRMLGAGDIIDRQLLAKPGQPLAKQRWAGAVDVAGGHTLANICASMRHGGVVAACGLAESMELHTSVAPFILRGVQLIGINSVYCPAADRQKAWQQLATDWDPAIFFEVIQTIGLADTIAKAGDLLGGKIRGRIVVDVNA